MPERPAPEECANCGAAIPRGAQACPECGADERTGWRETSESVYDGLDLPDDAFEDGDDARAKSTARRQHARRVNGIAWYWWCAGIALIIVLLLRFV